MSVAVLALGGVALAAYDGLGIWFLIKDFGVVQSCRASNVSVHTIWPTSLWTYVLFSLLFATGFTGMLMVVPVKRSIDAARKHLSRNRNGVRENGLNLKYGLLSTLPDWLFLWVGSAMICASMVLMILAFWGYWELFMARPWCRDAKTAFEELDLWYFGRVTWVLQVIAGVILFLWGLLYWGAPLCLEITSPPPLSDEQAPFAAGPMSP